MGATIPGATWFVIFVFILMALVPTAWYFYHVFKK